MPDGGSDTLAGITVSIPAGATTGTLRVTYGHMTHTGLTFKVSSTCP